MKSGIKPSYSLKRRLLTRMAVIFVVALLLLGVGIWRYAERAADYSFDRLLNGASLSILERIFVTTRGVEVDIPHSAMTMLSLAPDDRVFYQVIGPDGYPLTGYPDLPLPKDWQPGPTPYFFNAEYSGETVRFALLSRLLTEQGTEGWVTVQIGQTRLARSALARELVFNALGLLLLVMGIGLLFVWFGITRALNPLRLISRDLGNRSPTQLTPLELPAPKEISPLVGSLNTFMTRLQGNLNLLQSFIADAAHQIRTPMSTLQVQLDLAELESEDAEQRNRLQKATALSKRIIRLTNQLLAHALVIHRSDTQLPDKVDLVRLSRQLLTETVRDHAHRDLDFGFESTLEEALIEGDVISLTEALRNLLDNAIKYGPEDNHITLSVLSHRLTEGQSGYRVQVEDSGPGIPASQRSQVMERFVRLSRDQSGSGLGLAIVQAAAEAHHAELTLAESREGGLLISLDFPAMAVTTHPAEEGAP
ncbi:sensor histidine kinase [Pokkaliibacter sp. CJK22405]|uniref:sensor histidine kinase n=1 Tax=Pokkaliibacter sp. CJK22405 TaxID=3384615 RepID=UPI003984651F